jgi:hypothetical protein
MINGKTKAGRFDLLISCKMNRKGFALLIHLNVIVIPLVEKINAISR